MSEQGHKRGYFTSIAEDYFDGEAIRRLMFCYRTVGCAHYRSPEGGCRMCAFPAISTLGKTVDPEDLKEQLDNALASVDWEKEGLGELDLFCSGSFFNDEEVPPEVRRHAAESARNLPKLKKLLVESRPEYILPSDIDEMKEILGDDIRLEVAIGLESANEYVREEIIRKGFDLKDFENSLNTLGKRGTCLLVYVFLKPPGLSEARALEDTVATARYVFDCANRYSLPNVTAAIQPAFVQREGILFDLYQRGEYKPPWLWTVVEVIKRVHGLGEVQIGTSEDTPPPIATRANCGKCDERVEAAIAKYNEKQDYQVFEELHCQCKEKWRKEVIESCSE